MKKKKIEETEKDGNDKKDCNDNKTMDFTDVIEWTCMLDETSWMTRTNNINFHPTFLQHLSNISSNMLDKMLDGFNYALDSLSKCQ